MARLHSGDAVKRDFLKRRRAIEAGSPENPCAGRELLFDGSASCAIARQATKCGKASNASLQRILRRSRSVHPVPIHDTERSGLLLQGNIPCRIRRIVLSPFDPRKPGRQIRRQEQTDKTPMVLARQIWKCCPLSFPQEGRIENNRTSLGEDAHRGLRKQVIYTLRGLGLIGCLEAGLWFRSRRTDACARHPSGE